jgi:hypothetical protein
MKTMNFNELGGACDVVFQANSFEEIAELSKKHSIEMFQQEDAAHLKAMGEMQELIKSPEAMKNWFDAKRKEFNDLPEND